MKYSIENAKVIYETDSIIGKVLCSTPDAEIVHLILAPGAYIDPHRIPQNIFFFIISGSGKLLVNGKESLLKEGDVAFVDSRDERGWNNISSTQLVILGIKVKDCK